MSYGGYTNTDQFENDHNSVGSDEIEKSVRFQHLHTWQGKRKGKILVEPSHDFYLLPYSSF